MLSMERYTRRRRQTFVVLGEELDGGEASYAVLLSERPIGCSVSIYIRDDTLRTICELSVKRKIMSNAYVWFISKVKGDCK